MKTYYKATRVAGTDFYTGRIDYAAALASGERVRLTTPAQPDYQCCTKHVLHASDVPAETLLIGGMWPYRLFEVTGRPVASAGHKHGFRSLRVVREMSAHLALGPQGEQVAALIEWLPTMSLEQVRQVAAARGTVQAAAWAAARGTAWAAARDAAWAAAGDAARAAAGDAARAAAWAAAGDAAWAAAGDAAWAAAQGAAQAAARATAWAAAWDTAQAAARALVVRDLITPNCYRTLTAPIAAVYGPLHPDDEVTTDA